MEKLVKKFKDRIQHYYDGMIDHSDDLGKDCAEEAKRVAIEFAEWVGEAYDRNTEGTWGFDNPKTTKELFKQFLEEEYK